MGLFCSLKHLSHPVRGGCVISRGDCTRNLWTTLKILAGPWVVVNANKYCKVNGLRPFYATSGSRASNAPLICCWQFSKLFLRGAGDLEVPGHCVSSH